MRENGRVNKKLQLWFSRGNSVEALCGLGEYFIPNPTYRDDHDFGLAVGQLIEWAKQGNHVDAAKGFEGALNRLLQAGSLRSALRLLRAYGIISQQAAVTLPLDEKLLEFVVRRAVQRCGPELAHDQDLRNLLLLVIEQFPSLRTLA
jgi:hypothetical protein